MERFVGQDRHVVLRDEGAVGGSDVEECGRRHSIVTTIAAPADNKGTMKTPLFAGVLRGSLHLYTR